MTGFDTVQSRERGLRGRLTAGQMSMIAIGGAIGTGLFLGSKLAFSLAGPATLISYVVAGVVALAVMGCLAEMTTQHPTSGSFGAYAEYYVNPLSGFLVRYCYWLSIVLGVGTEVTAVATYMQFWFHGVPGWVWIVGFSALLIVINAYSVRVFGTLEYWFSTIKIIAIVGFILTGVGLLLSLYTPAVIEANVLGEGGFLPYGWKGVWFASIVAIFSYFSIEMIAVAAAESENPEQSVRRAFTATIWRLLVFYLGSLAVVIMLVPWRRVIDPQASSPYVTAMQMVGLPFADGVLNFVVIVASLSSMNSMLYVSTRILFSLSRAGDAPRFLGRVWCNGVPISSLIVSAGGIGVATVIYLTVPQDAFAIMIALSMFGAMFAWGMIFVTHFFFRSRIRREAADLKLRIPGYPYGTALGLAGVVMILIGSWFTSQFHLMLPFGVPLCIVLTLVYVARGRLRQAG